MYTNHLRTLAVFGTSLAFFLVVGGGFLAGAIITGRYALAALLLFGLGIILGAIGYSFVAAVRRWEREARVQRRLETTLMTTQPMRLR